MDSIIYLIYILKKNKIPLEIIEGFFVTCDVDKKTIENFKISTQHIMGAIKGIEDNEIKKDLEVLVQSHIKKNIEYFKQQKKE